MKTFFYLPNDFNSMMEHSNYKVINSKRKIDGGEIRTGAQSSKPNALLADLPVRNGLHELNYRTGRINT